MNIQDKDQFGFYKVGDLKFYSKLQALEMQQHTNIFPTWHFNESTFKSIDWSIEPKESLSELYKKRAQQIREKYDYIVIWYSGAADSENVVQSFLSNGIKVDELASYNNYEATKDTDDWFNNEIHKVAVPRFKKIFKELQPGLKHRIVDVSNLIINHFKTKNTGSDWIYNQNSMLGPNNACRHQIRYTVPEWDKIINSGKKFAFIWGCEKPRLYKINGKYCIRFIDIVDHAVSPIQQIMPRAGEFDELFYWSIDLPELIIKQGHVLKNFLKLCNNDSTYLQKEPTYLGSAWKEEDNGTKKWLTINGLHSLIYPKYSYSPDSQGKIGTMILTPRDKWFFNLSDDVESRKNWKVGLEKLWNTLSDYWKNDSADITKGLKQMLSIPYFLEK
jgi:hypothetical protein